MRTIILILTAFFSLSTICQSQVIGDLPVKNPRQIQLPYNRLIQPAGLQIFFGEDSLENHSLNGVISPDGLCLSADEKSLYIANGMDNAIAVIKLGKKSSVQGRDPVSIVTGYIPTGAYPSFGNHEPQIGRAHV
jgi:hypothetical protein